MPLDRALLYWKGTCLPDPCFPPESPQVHGCSGGKRVVECCNWWGTAWIQDHSFFQSQVLYTSDWCKLYPGGWPWCAMPTPQAERWWRFHWEVNKHSSTWCSWGCICTSACQFGFTNPWRVTNWSEPSQGSRSHACLAWKWGGLVYPGDEVTGEDLINVSHLLMGEFKK